MKEIIVRTQKELNSAVKQKNVKIIIRDTTEWIDIYDLHISSISNGAKIKYISGRSMINTICPVAAEIAELCEEE